ncbi:MAG TPA: hypothetical protein VKC57_15010, partial [Ktedonobacterales bacterium]|nr:hypothetical protein [Ktedonobacterales bacterium]
MLTETFVIVSGPVPALITETVNAGVVVCIDWAPKSRLAGLACAVGDTASSAKAAFTVLATVGAMVQGAAALQPPPLQPVKTEPPEGAALNVSEAPVLKLAAHVAPQLRPAG